MKNYAVLFLCAIYLGFVSTATFTQIKTKPTFAHWKDEIQKGWIGQTIDEQKMVLKNKIDEAMRRLEVTPGDEYYQIDLLFAYNYLREFYNLPAAKSIPAIDTAWFHQVEYDMWKAKKRSLWERDSITTLSAKKNNLLRAFNANYDLANDPAWNDTYSFKREALFNYNYLRELFNESGAKTLEESNRSWLAQVGYELWKQNRQESWKMEQKTEFSSQLADLASLAARALAKQKPEAESILNPYNYLRELLKMPLASSLDMIDAAWFEEVKNELELFALIEGANWQLPTEAQKALVAEGARLLNFQQQVEAAATNKPGLAYSTTRGEKGYIALCQTPDLDTRLASLYHEFGHLAHKDTQNAGLLNSRFATPGQFLDQNDVKHDLADMARYLKLGLATIPSLYKINLGKRLSARIALPEVQNALHQYHSLWIPPTDPVKREKREYLRSTEKRADLFMLRELAKQKRFSAILREIETYGNTDWYFISNEQIYSHPSDIERALYMIGFLIDQKIDVASLMEKWEKTGICIDAEQANYGKLFSSAIRPRLALQIQKKYGADELKEYSSR